MTQSCGTYTSHLIAIAQRGDILYRLEDAIAVLLCVSNAKIESTEEVK